MSFRIVTTVSSDYRFVLDRCLPSWYHNSGASRIDVHLHETSTDRHRWAMNVIERCRNMQKAVHEAAGEKLLFLDADCLVVDNLAGGFSDRHPISVARWPNINLGVLFLNMTLGYDVVGFMDRFAARGIDYCTKHKASQGLDQNVMIEMLADIEGKVCKLHDAVWNCQIRNDTTREQATERKTRAKILHLVGAGGGPKKEREWKELMQRVL